MPSEHWSLQTPFQTHKVCQLKVMRFNVEQMLDTRGEPRWGGWPGSENAKRYFNSYLLHEAGQSPAGRLPYSPIMEMFIVGNRLVASTKLILVQVF